MPGLDPGIHVLILQAQAPMVFEQKDLGMSNGLTPSQSFSQELATIIVKALLSSVPMATLVFDIGQAAVNFGNAKVLNQFIDGLAARIAALEADQKETIQESPCYEIAAHGVLRMLLSESNRRVADILARAVVKLPLMKLAPTCEQQCARIFLEANEPFLHALQTNDRFQRGVLTLDERMSFGGIDESQPKQFATLLNASMSFPDWQSIIERLMQLGLVERRRDFGDFSNDPMVDTAPVSKFGRVFLDLCFDGDANPALGKFAV